MDCGEEIRVRDINGAFALRIIAQCHGRFMLISHTGDYRNGYLLADWRAVLRELVAMAVPGKLIEKLMTAEGSSGGQYRNIPLAYPLSTNGLADLLGVSPGDVREQLDDMLVEAD